MNIQAALSVAMIHAKEIVNSGDVLHVGPLAQGTIGYSPKISAHLRIFLQPDIAAVLTPDDGIACKLRVAFLTNVDDDLSIASADLQRHGAIVDFGVAIAESADKATHRTYLSLAFASISMKSFDCSVVAFYATTYSVRRGVYSSLVSL
jgi:hypothetical protein